MFYTPTKQPLIIREAKNNQLKTLWLDKYYVAIQINYNPVVYTYISLYHITEEIKAWKEVNQRPPEEIITYFRDAVTLMRASGKRTLILI